MTKFRSLLFATARCLAGVSHWSWHGERLPPTAHPRHKNDDEAMKQRVMKFSVQRFTVPSSGTYSHISDLRNQTLFRSASHTATQGEERHAFLDARCVPLSAKFNKKRPDDIQHLLLRPRICSLLLGQVDQSKEVDLPLHHAIMT